MLENDDAMLDWRDYFDHHTLPLSRRNLSRWPHHPTGYRQVIAEYSDQASLLAQKLLELISESLGLPRQSWWPSGVEDGNWVTVQPVPGAIIVMLADQTEIITNGVYRSAEHPAITNSNRARLSLATFHGPTKLKKVSPFPRLTSPHLPDRIP
ncbi:hypothetical protein SAY87_031761 [Trapa incisa]|uniref:Isopenicillin N synthase-like Fe(2+) 2OG dioxygenase domain-containing protein n=1 Tax=Trapa incisa TaxID=236973 RepID=A0AAN7QLF4_9MYRT|nr:hypothetical protein SAY87_031761 [Trapa incisa]